ncbi:hypothetical protein ACFVFS_30990 [Kitasatospora sp. NPDC057692]
MSACALGARPRAEGVQQLVEAARRSSSPAESRAATMGSAKASVAGSAA